MTTITVDQPTYVIDLAVEGSPSIQVTTTGDPVIQVQEVGIQGPPGPAAESFTATAAANVSALVAVSQYGDTVRPCNPNSASDLAALAGIAFNAAIAGGQVTVRRAGTMADASWSWIVGLPIFCGLSGALTQTPPVAVGVRQVAVATGATEILLNIADLFLME
jgi:hypothetical protein